MVQIQKHLNNPNNFEVYFLLLTPSSLPRPYLFWIELAATCMATAVS